MKLKPMHPDTIEEIYSRFIFDEKAGIIRYNKDVTKQLTKGTPLKISTATNFSFVAGERVLTLAIAWMIQTNEIPVWPVRLKDTDNPSHHISNLYQKLPKTDKAITKIYRNGKLINTFKSDVALGKKGNICLHFKYILHGFEYQAIICDAQTQEQALGRKETFLRSLKRFENCEKKSEEEYYGSDKEMLDIMLEPSFN